jgi:hypothetical protein
VTGRITTKGAAGTVSYQWVSRPGRQPPQTLSQSVAAGQNAVDVTDNVEGQVLGPDTGSASTAVVLSC